VSGWIAPEQVSATCGLASTARTEAARRARIVPVLPAPVLPGPVLARTAFGADGRLRSPKPGADLIFRRVSLAGCDRAELGCRAAALA
jgi:hypothetical protein